MDEVARDLSLIIFYLIMIGILITILSLVRRQTAKMHELEKQFKILGETHKPNEAEPKEEELKNG